MRKIIALLAVTTIGMACKEETQEKLKEASAAVSTDVKESIDSVKTKAENAIDSSKVGAKELLVKGAEKVEQEAKKIKELAKE
jgi:formate-dependent nitrite reductase cytochrome c552 subunit